MPPQRSQISSNCLGKISAPRFRVKPVSSRLSSHISISSLPEMAKGKRKHFLYHSKVPSIKIRSLLIIFPLCRSGLLVDFRAYEEVLIYRHFSVSCFFVTQRTLKLYENKLVSDAN